MHGLSDGLQVTLGDNLELALKGGQELDEILGLSLCLLELLALSLVLVEDVSVLRIFVLEQRQDLLDGR